MGDLYASTGSSLGPLMSRLSLDRVPRGFSSWASRLPGLPWGGSGGRQGYLRRCHWHSWNFSFTFNWCAPRPLLEPQNSGKIFTRIPPNPANGHSSKSSSMDQAKPWTLGAPPVLLMMEIWKYRRFNNCNIIGSSLVPLDFSTFKPDFCPDKLPGISPRVPEAISLCILYMLALWPSARGEESTLRSDRQHCIYIAAIFVSIE